MRPIRQPSRSRKARQYPAYARHHFHSHLDLANAFGAPSVALLTELGNKESHFKRIEATQIKSSYIGLIYFAFAADGSLVIGELGRTTVNTMEVEHTLSEFIEQPAFTVAPISEECIKSADLQLVVEFVGEANGHMDAAESSLLVLEGQPEGRPESQSHLSAILRAFHTIKGMAGFLNLRQIGALAHAAENLLDRARKGIAPLEDHGVDLILKSVDQMRQMIAAVDQSAKSGQAPPSQQGFAEIMSRLTKTAGLSASTQKDGKTPAFQPPIAADAASVSADATIKVTTERLDALINTVGELVIAQSMANQDVCAMPTAGGQRLARNMSHLGKITRSLQELSMAMRMVPIQGVFQKMARLARDVASKAGKEIEFVQVGGETELDRNVVEAVSDPLVHMIRNAIDHGIEPPQQRALAGKPPAGRVQLKACHQGGNVVVEISDDGGGLNKQKILAKAISCGIVKEGQPLDDDEIFRLIFHAGLSTAEKVSELSGRGVGMDVVRKNVESLRGRIDITSVEGRGSLFTIRLPLTLAVIDGLVVNVGSHRYIIPILSIEQSLRPKGPHLKTVQGRDEVYVIRDRVLPLVRMHKLFDISDAIEDPLSALIVIVRSDQSRCCLLVDNLLGQQQVVIKSLGQGVGRVPGISGGAILGDGNVSLILDVPGLMDMAMAARN